jgi:hypothetical protein
MGCKTKRGKSIGMKERLILFISEAVIDDATIRKLGHTLFG